MSFLLLEAINIKKSYAGKTILDIKSLRIYADYKIGFIGANGLGKTTLLDILAGDLEPDEGEIRRYCDIAYIRQFAVEDDNKQASLEASREDNQEVNRETSREVKREASREASREESAPLAEPNFLKKLSEYRVLDKARDMKVSGGETMHGTIVSGGEMTRLKIAYAFGADRQLVFADEPTSNLDAGGIEQFGKELSALQSFILISHDRSLLNRYCNIIMTIENGDVVLFEGIYDEYRRVSLERKKRAEFEFAQYENEKERLQRVYADKKAKAVKAAKKPRNMSSGEIKQRDFVASRRSFDGKQRSFDSAAKAVQARINQMEVKEKPPEMPIMKLDFSLTDPPMNKIVLSGSKINFSYGANVIFSDASFTVKNGARVALCGENGSGKTTLFNLIYRNDECIYRVPKARIGYFYQGFENIEQDKTVLQNIMNDCVQTETAARSVLARLLFRRDEIHKRAGVLSGGERIKLGLAKLLVSRNNILMLDEPTNYLDMPSIEALQNILSNYDGTLLLVSHDREFIDAVCTDMLTIKNKQIIAYERNLSAADKA